MLQNVRIGDPAAIAWKQGAQGSQHPVLPVNQRAIAIKGDQADGFKTHAARITTATSPCLILRVYKGEAMTLKFPPVSSIIRGGLLIILALLLAAGSCVAQDVPLIPRKVI